MCDTALPVTAWNAHIGHGLLFVDGERVPEATRAALERRSRGVAFIYLLGDPSIICAAVARQLGGYGHVQRIPGRDAIEISANLASFHDAGFNQGCWLGSWNRDFGRDTGEPGQNFTFANPANWQQAVTGSLLSHMGSMARCFCCATVSSNRRSRSTSEQCSRGAWRHRCSSRITAGCCALIG